MAARLLHHLLEVEVGLGTKRTTLKRWEETQSAIKAYTVSAPPYTYLVNVVPVRDGKLLGELPLRVHKLVVVSHQEHGGNQLHLQLGHLHPGARVSTGTPTKIWVGGGRDRVRSEPSARIILVWLRVEFRVQVDFADRIGEEISTPDEFAVDSDIFANVPSEGGASEGKSLRLSGASFEDGQIIFPRREGNGAELIVRCCEGDRVAKVMGKQVLDFLFALLPPLIVDGEIDKCPACCLV